MKSEQDDAGKLSILSGSRLGAYDNESCKAECRSLWLKRWRLSYFFRLKNILLETGWHFQVGEKLY